MPPKKTIVIEEPRNVNTIESTDTNWKSLFSTKYSGLDYMGAFGSTMTNNPYVQNQRLKQLKSMPVFFSREILEESLKNPSTSEQSMREASWALSTTTYPLYKLMRLYSDILTYNNYSYSKYVDPKDMKTPRYKSEEKLVHMFIDELKPKYTFRRIALEVAREGKRAYAFRIDAENKTGSEQCNTAFLQEIPSNWWKPTSKTGNSYYGASFNFAYFWTAGTSIDQFPPSWRKYYTELMGCTVTSHNGIKTIDPTKLPKDMIAECSGGQWFYWRELPSDECFVFSSDESHAWISPSFAGLFLQTQDLSSYQLLQQQLTSIPLNSMVLAEIPMHEKGNSGNSTNDLRLSEALVLGFTELFNNSAPSGTALYPAPFENFKHITFPNVPNGEKVYHEAISQFASTAGTNGILSTSDKPTVAQVKSSQILEARLADNIYEQFMNCVNIMLKKKLGLKYTWRFKMFGNVFEDEKKIATLEKGLSLGLNFLLPQYGAILDNDMEDMDALCNQVNTSGIYDKFKPLVSAFQQKGTDDKAGRKTIDNPDNDNTEKSQSAGSNTKDGKSFNTVCKHCGESYSDLEFSPFCNESCLSEYHEEN